MFHGITDPQIQLQIFYATTVAMMRDLETEINARLTVCVLNPSGLRTSVDYTSQKGKADHGVEQFTSGSLEELREALLVMKARNAAMDADAAEQGITWRLPTSLQ
jgi:hypothetical protein